MAEKTWLSSAEVAQLLMATPLSVCEWVQQGRLHAALDAADEQRFQLQDIHRFARESQLLLTRPERERLRVLVADADPAAARILLGLLDSLAEGLEARAAHNAFDAGCMMHSFRPDVVLLDFQLSQHDSFEICRRIKANPASHGVKVIAMSGRADRDMAQRARMAGAEACIAKPLQTRHLFEALGLRFEPLSSTDPSC